MKEAPSGSQEVLEILINQVGLTAEQINLMKELGFKVVREEGGGGKEQKSEFQLRIDNLRIKLDQLKKHFGQLGGKFQNARLVDIYLERADLELSQIVSLGEHAPPYKIISVQEALEQAENLLPKLE